MPATGDRASGYPCPSARSPRRRPPCRLHANNVSEDFVDLTRCHEEIGHIGMFDRDTLGERLRQRVYRIALRQCSEWGCVRMAARIIKSDGMATAAVSLNQKPTLLDL